MFTMTSLTSLQLKGRDKHWLIHQILSVFEKFSSFFFHDFILFAAPQMKRQHGGLIVKSPHVLQVKLDEPLVAC